MRQLALTVWIGMGLVTGLQAQMSYIPEEFRDFRMEQEILDENKDTLSAQTHVETSIEEYYDPGSEAFQSNYETSIAKAVHYEPRKTVIAKTGPAEKFNFDYSGVEITKDTVMIDSAWFQIAPYYKAWDSYHVDPYRVDPLSFKDTLPIYLYDSLRGHGWSMPQKRYYKTSTFGPRGWRYHYGVDLKLHTGDSVRSVWDGVVRVVSYDRRGFGNYVVVRHLNGLETVYGHLSKRLVKQGTYIKAGQTIGLGGSTGRSTGPHLHFEIRYDGNPIDPEEIFDFSANWRIKDNYYLLLPSAWDHIRERRRIVYHRIRPGDTLGHLAMRYHVSINYICRLNGIRRSSTLRVGRRLRVR